MEFNNYLEKMNLNIACYSDNLKEFFQICYEKYHIGLVPFTSSRYTEEDIKIKLNDQIRRRYKIQFHNIGKNPYKRYYANKGHYAWLKLEHFLINHFNRIDKSISKISNKRIAESLGWLSPGENDPEIINKALRKVTDNLAILKNERKTISVVQKYVYGKKGSYHEILANWHNIITLYTQYNDNAPGSIRFRKSIRYRIISFIRTKAKTYSRALADLIQKQKNSYLKNLVTFNLPDFKDLMLVLKTILSKHKELSIPKAWINSKNIIPEYNNNSLVLTVKNQVMYNELSNTTYLKDDLKRKYDINLSLIAAF